MASRYDQREIVVQALFEADFNSLLDLPNVKEYLLRDAKEFLLLDNLPEFADALATGVILKRETIDEIIEKAAPEWPIAKISFMDRALLRLGIYELIYGSALNIPPKVAINEAIELSKAFGGDNSRKFVNGVLGGIYKEMKDSGVIVEEERRDRKDQVKQEIVIENLVGSIVYKYEDDVYKLAFIKDLFKYYTFPKGHVDEGDSEINKIIEITQSEAGLHIEPITFIAANTYTADNKGRILKKNVRYFLCKLINEDVFVSSEAGVDRIWASKNEIENLKIYKDIRPMIESAFDKLENSK